MLVAFLCITSVSQAQFLLLWQIVDTDQEPNRIYENVARGTTVSGVSLSTQSPPDVNPLIVWQITSIDTPFAIDSVSGVISYASTATLDYETTTSTEVVVRAIAETFDARETATLTVSIAVQNIFEEVRVSDSDNTANTIVENTANGTVVSGLSLQAKDEGDRTLASVAWSVGSALSRFAISSTNGVLSYASNEVLDYEATPSPEVIVQAVAVMEGVTMTGSLTVTIAVLNISEVIISDSDNTANTIAEDAPFGTRVDGVHLQATYDTGMAVSGARWLTLPGGGNRFVVNSDIGVLYYIFAGALDYETATMHEAVVQVTASANDVTITGSLTVTIAVINVLETVTIIDNDSTANTLVENASSGISVTGMIMQAVDEGGRVLSGVEWSIVSSPTRFAISSTSGALSYASSEVLDYEAILLTEVMVQAVAVADSVTVTGSLAVSITVLNVLEVVAISDGDITANTLAENVASGTVVSGVSLQAVDEADTALSGVVWSIVPADSRFSIDSGSGAISYASNETLDHEEIPSTEVVVQAVAVADSVTVTGSLAVSITVLNVLEVVAISDGDITANTLAENVASGTVVSGVSLQAVDEADTALSGVVWSIVPADSRFSIDSGSGAISYVSNETLDHEEIPSTEVVVQAVVVADSVTVTGSLAVSITVLNVLEVVAISDGDTTANTLAENIASGTVVSGVSLQAVDEAGTVLSGIVWSIASAPTRYAISSTSRAISYASSEVLDYEETSSAEVVVRAIASVGNVTLTGTLTVTIIISDVLELLVIVDQNSQDNTLISNAVSGTVVAGISLQAQDETSQMVSGVRWSITSDTVPLAISEAGMVSWLSDMAPSDTLPSYTVVVQAVADRGGVTLTGSLEITIEIVIEGTIVDRDGAGSESSEAAAVGSVISGLALEVRDGNGQRLIEDIRWRLFDDANSLFTISSTSGEVSLNAVLDYETSTVHTIEITASSGNQAIDATLTIAIAVLNVLETVTISDSNGTANIIAENATSGTSVAGLSLQVSDEAGATLDDVIWSVMSADNHFAISATNNVLSYAATATLDYEVTPSTEVVVQAVASVDNVTVTGTLTVLINVKNVFEYFEISYDSILCPQRGCADKGLIVENVASGTKVLAYPHINAPLTLFVYADSADVSVRWSIVSGDSRFTVEPQPLRYDSGDGRYSLSSISILYTSSESLDYEAIETMPSSQAWITIVVQAVGVHDDVTLTETINQQIFVRNILEEVRIRDGDGTTNTLAENVASGTVVSGLNLQAVDEAGTTLIDVAWSVVPADNRYTISSTSGAISYASSEALDYEETSSTEVVVQAIASVGNVTLTGTLTVTITIINVFEFLTVVDHDPQDNMLTTDVVSGTEVFGMRIQAQDEVGHTLSGVHWSITSDTAPFAISEAGAVSWLSDTSPSSTLPPYMIVVQAVADRRGVTLTGTLAVTIEILDAIGEVIVDSDADRSMLSEAAEINTTVPDLTLQLRDPYNQLITEDVSWRLTDDANGLFAISATSGVVRLIGSLDYETSTVHTIEINALLSEQAIDNILTVTIAVSNVLELLRIETNRIGNFVDDILAVYENGASDTAVFFLNRTGRELLRVWAVTDVDVPVDWTVQVRIGPPDILFAISMTKVYALAGTLDYERVGHHSLNLGIKAVATGKDGKMLTRRTDINVRVLDAIEVLRLIDKFPSTTNTIVENVPPHTLVAGFELFVERGDMSSQGIWQVVPIDSRFAVEHGSLRYASTATLDYETTPSTEVIVQYIAIDNVGEELTATVTVTIVVENVLEEVEISDSDTTANMLSENVASGTAVSGLSLQAQDEGGRSLDSVVWSVASTETRFAIDNGSGALSYASTAALDYEATSSAEVMVQAVAVADGVTITGSLAVVITIEDVLESLNINEDGSDNRGTVLEETTGAVVSGLNLRVFDEGGNLLSSAVWSLVTTDTQFMIASMTGVVQAVSALDYELTTSHILSVSVTAEKGGVAQSTSVTLTISVYDVVEGLTVSDADATTNTISELAATGSEVSSLSLQVTDENDTLITTVNWVLLSNPDDLFAINSTSGEVRLAKAVLDYERIKSYTLIVRARFTDPYPIAGDIALSIVVLNELEHVTIMDVNRAVNTIAENVASGTAVSGLSLQASDEGGTVLDGVVWSVATTGTRFAIDSASGALSYASTVILDYEASSSAEVIVQVVAISGGVTVTGSLMVPVSVLNVLEMVMVSDSDNTENTLLENVASGTAVAGLSLQAIDEDGTVLDGVVWSFASILTRFAIDSVSGALSYASTATLDYERTPSTEVVVQAVAVADDVTVTGSLIVPVSVLNVLETVVISDSDNTEDTLSENAANGMTVSGVRLQVVDEGGSTLSSDSIVWSVATTENRFAIDSVSGVLSYVSSEVLDYEASSSVEVIVQAVAISDGVSVTSSLIVSITVLNVLETVVISDSDTTANMLSENVVSGTAVSGLSLQASDEGGTILSGVVWSVATTETRFAIDSASGALSYASTATLDYETTPSVEVIVEAVAIVSGVTVTGGLTVPIAVLNVLEEVVISDGDSTTNTIAENASTGTVVSGLSLETQDDGNALPPVSVRWSIAEATGAFTIGSTSGEVVSTMPLDYEMLSSTELVVSVMATQVSRTVVSLLTITIEIVDLLEELRIGDEGADGRGTVLEGVSGVVVEGLNLQALDESGNALMLVEWSLASTRFEIGMTSGVVRLQSGVSLDYEDVDDREHSLTVMLSAQKGGVMQTTATEIIVSLLNVLEEVVISDSDNTTNTLSENISSGTLVSGVSLQALDEAGRALSGVIWSVASTETRFAIDSVSGALSYASSEMLDYEATPSAEVIVEAVASADDVTVSGRLTVVIEVLNVLETVVISDSDNTANTIGENISSGTVVVGVSLQAVADVSAATISWSIASTGTRFVIDSDSGAISYASLATLDYELTPSTEVVVQAVASADGVSVTGSLIVPINVLNVLELVMVSDSDTTVNTLSENVSSGTLVSGVSLQAVDEAGTALSGVMWSIASTGTRFAIDNASGAISYGSTGTLDYELTPTAEVIVEAVASADNVTLIGTLTVAISVLNVLETVSISDSDNTANTIAENASSGTLVSGVSLQAVDEAGTELSSVMWSVASTETRFAIDSVSGAISYGSTEILDYELTPTAEVIVEAVADDVTVTGSLVVPISVLNVLETVVISDSDNTVNTLSENVSSGAPVFGVSLQALADVSTATISWSIASTGTRFAIDSDSGAISYGSTATLDYEETPTAEVIVEAVASADGVKVTGSLTVPIMVLNVLETIAISDSDDDTANTISENAPSGTAVGGVSLQAVVDVSAAAISWGLATTGTGFAIDRDSGVLSYASTATLDYELTPSTEVVVQAVAISDGVSVTGSLIVPITVLNVLETVVISDSDTTANTLSENVASGTAVSGLRLQVVDEGGRTPSSDSIVWSVATTEPRFVIDSGSGALSYASSATLDYEVTPTAEVIVQAVAVVSGVTVTGSLTVPITVLNVLEMVAISDSDTTANTLSENVSSGTLVSGVSLQAVDEAGTVLSGVVWSIASIGTRFVIDSDSGAISYASTATLDYELTASTEVVVQAVAISDGVSVMSSLIVSITVLNVLETVVISDSDTTANTLSENVASGTVVSGLRLQVVDEGGSMPSSDSIVWNVSSTETRFVIDSVSGVLSYASSEVLDYEATPSAEVIVQAVAIASDVTVTGGLTVPIAVLNVLEEVVISDGDTTANTLSENAASGTAVAGLSLRATDEGGTILSGAVWRIASTATRFTIDNDSGVLSYASLATLDYEQTPSVEVIVEAVAVAGGVTITGSLTVPITVLNVLETVVITDSDNTANTLSENVVSGTVVSGVRLQVVDEGGSTLSSDSIVWSVATTETRFAIDSASGALSYASTATLDYETTPSVEVIVEAVAVADDVTVTGSLTVPVSVLNVLEIVMVSDSDGAVNTLSENVASGTVVSGVRLQVVDEGGSTLSSDSIVWSVATTETRFAIDSVSGALSYASTATLDYETTPSVEVIVEAVAVADDVTVTGSLTVPVSVLNVLEIVMVSDSDGAVNTLSENVASGTAVSGVRLQVVDEGGSTFSSDSIVWNVATTETRFAIDSASGALSYASLATLDYERTPLTEVVVEAVAVAGDVTITGSLTVPITVLNVLETVVMSDSDNTVNTIEENVSSGTLVSGVSLQVVDEGNRSLSGVVWSLASTSTRFAIDSSRVLSYASTTTLDYELTPLTEVLVQAVASADDVTLTANLIITITITDVFELLTVVDQNGQDNTLTTNAVSGTAVGGMLLQAQDETNQMISAVNWSITSDTVPFAISEGGVVSWLSDTSPSGTPASYRVVVQAVAARSGVTLTGTLGVEIEILSTVSGMIVDTDGGGSGLSEDAAINTAVPNLTLEARDTSDQPITEGITWHLSDDGDSLFAINSTSGAVRLVGSLNYEASTVHTIEVTALFGNQAIDARLTVAIGVLNVLEAVAVSDSDGAANTLSENIVSGTAVSGLSLQAVADVSTATISWSIASTATRFAIDSVSGALSYASSGTLDYEVTPSAEVVVQAVAISDSVSVTGRLTVLVGVLNVLEMIVVRDIDNTANTLSENVASGTVVSGVRLQVVDEGGSTLSSDSIVWSVATTETRFAIDSASGALSYASTATLDYELTPTAEVIVEAVAVADDVTVTGSLTVPVSVLNVLETVVMSDSDGTVNTLSENVVSGTVVSGVRLQVVDEGGSTFSSDSIVWSIATTGTRFAIDSVSGALSYASTATLNYETTPSVEVIVEAVAVAGDVTITGSLIVPISVLNVLETVVISDSDNTANTLSENVVSGTVVSGVRLQVVDEGGSTFSSDSIVWSVATTETRFAIDSASGALSYASTATLDYETTPSVEVIVEAVAVADDVTITGSLIVPISVLNVLETVVISDSDNTVNTLSENVASGTAVSGLRLQVVDEGGSMPSSDSIVWSVATTETRFAIDSASEY